ncbi:hypothetical protein BURKHO8Y_120166 [Burkholderia sp. 8Y]|nr:hypothetical protein BURKHO8Y_120166 [Burkholderia sp. 8Y]
MTHDSPMVWIRARRARVSDDSKGYATKGAREAGADATGRDLARIQPIEAPTRERLHGCALNPHRCMGRHDSCVYLRDAALS